MKARNDNIAIDKIRELFNYDPMTGIFSYKKRRGRMAVGDMAGTRHAHGYVQLSIDGQHYLAHRVAWALHYGAHPSGVIDHINGVKDDNRIINLRDATMQVNMENIYQARKDSSSGLLGAHKAKGGKWHAKITLHGKTIYIGTYDTAEDAHIAYIKEKRKVHGGSML